MTENLIPNENASPNLHSLSPLILESVGKHLGVSEVYQLRRVSRKLNSLLRRSYFCRQMCQMRLTELNLLNKLVLPLGTSWQWLALCLIHEKTETGTSPQENLKKTQSSSHQSYGILKKKNGDVYIGEFVNGSMEGKGVYISITGRIFSGDWKNDQREGAGWEFQPNSSIKIPKDLTSTQNQILARFELEDTSEEYWGYWKNNLPYGRGCKFFPGGVYDGTWKNGLREGHGSIWWNSGSNYQGYWVEDQKQGQGVYTWQSGDRYEGLWNQSRYLEGKYLSYFGSSYNGKHDPLTGIYSGKGRFEHPDGTFWEGDWNNGIPSNPSEAYHPELRKALEEGLCTKRVTGNTNFYGQVLYLCSCESKMICENCFSRCHRDHQIFRTFWTIGRSVCNCSCSSHITRSLYQNREMEINPSTQVTEPLEGIEDRTPLKIGHLCSFCPDLPQLPYFYPSSSVRSKILKRHYIKK